MLKIRNFHEYFTAGVVTVEKSCIRVIGFLTLPKYLQESILFYINDFNEECAVNYQYKQRHLFILVNDKKYINKISRGVLQQIDNTSCDIVNKKTKILVNDINFDDVYQKSKKYALLLLNNKDDISSSLEEYETYNVVLDEIERAVDLLENLDKNKDFFVRKTNKIISFLPLNQPLYAVICFGVVPSLMSNSVYVRPPEAMWFIFKKLNSILKLEQYFPSLHISYDTRSKFIEKHKIDTNIIIFTGKPENGRRIRNQFSPELLFILNGAGHNPIVVTQTANVKQAVESVICVSTQNQGQDCSCPNAVLVHDRVLDSFKTELFKQLNNIKNKIGSTRNKNNIIGPNTDYKHPLKMANIFTGIRDQCIYGGQINPTTGVIYPTVFEKILSTDANYQEFFSPVIYIHSYDSDQKLQIYFETEEYKENAMYVSVFGNSKYIKSTVDKGLHLPSNILQNTDLHKTEHVYLPYGGLGKSASCIYINGKCIAKPTLPQRDIFEYLNHFL